jgi:hypothetical protein
VKDLNLSGDLFKFVRVAREAFQASSVNGNGLCIFSKWLWTCLRFISTSDKYNNYHYKILIRNNEVKNSKTCFQINMSTRMRNPRQKMPETENTLPHTPLTMSSTHHFQKKLEAKSYVTCYKGNDASHEFRYEIWNLRIFLPPPPWIEPLFGPRCIQNSAYTMSFIISSYSSGNIPLSTAVWPYVPSLPFSPPVVTTFNQKSEDVPGQSKSRSKNKKLPAKRRGTALSPSITRHSPRLEASNCIILSGHICSWITCRETEVELMPL